MNKKKNIIFYTLFMILMFIIVSELLTGIGTVLFANYLNDIVNYNKYGYYMYIEIAVCFTILIVLLLSGNSYIFKCKKEGLFSSLKKGWPLYIVLILFLPTITISILKNGINTNNLLTLFIFCLAIGIYEELLCRGWLLNEFLERFGNTKKGVIISIIISSCIFGLMHITNIEMQSGLETFIQIINAAAMGVVLGTIYYKSQNIYAVIILHAFWDFCLFIPEHTLLMDCSTIGTPSTILIIVSFISQLFLSLYYIFTSIIIMKSKKVIEKDKLVFNKKSNKALVIISIICFIGFLFINFIPVDSGTYEDVCYEFKEKYVEEYIIHKVVKSKFEIEEDMYKYSLYVEDNKAYIRNEITKDVNEFPIDNVNSISVIKNNNEYLLLIDTTNNEVFYSNYITINNMSNSKEYLNRIIRSLEEKYFPSSTIYGYMNLEDDEYNYPCLSTYYNEIYIIDKDGTEVVIRK